MDTLEINGEMKRKDHPLIVSYGAGVDSTAMILGLYRSGWRPDYILFADVGNEKPDTYAYLPIINKFLKGVGFPTTTTVQYRPKRFKHHPYQTLAGNCISNRTLPSLAFGYKSCSLKWKAAALDKFVKNVYGESPCYRAIGYDCGAKDKKRFAHAIKKKGKFNRPGDVFVYPLQHWGWDRGRCTVEITEAGLPVPPKSSCYFCPSMKPEELSDLPEYLLRRIVILEANASPKLTKIVGLWRRKRMTDYIKEHDLLPEQEIEALWSLWSGEYSFGDSDASSDSWLDLMSEDGWMEKRKGALYEMPPLLSAVSQNTVQLRDITLNGSL